MNENIIEESIMMLIKLQTYFDNMADADYDYEAEKQVPNQAMKICIHIDDLIEDLKEYRYKPKTKNNNVESNMNEDLQRVMQVPMYRGVTITPMPNGKFKVFNTEVNELNAAKEIIDGAYLSFNQSKKIR
jgi:hypothetical protein